MDFFLINLGCAKNLVESENLTKHLIQMGYMPVDDIQEADLVIINTCGFIGDAKKESIETILEALQNKSKEAPVVVFGCLVQRYLRELKDAIPEVELFLPVMPPDEIARAIKNHFPPVIKKNRRERKILFTPPTYKYVKISDGCINYCSYCVIPMIRGPLKSRKIEDIVREIELSLEDGVFEFNLIGQDITAYGKDLYGDSKLVELVNKILEIKKKFWLRLLYLYPTRIPNKIIEIMKDDERLIPYLDIPIQHVNDRILKLMNRDYTKSELFKVIENLRKKVPNIVLRTSLITGFPSESEEEFNEVVDFIKEIEFDHLGVFTYSPEEDTPAVNLRPLIPERTKSRRKRILMEEQYKIVKKKLNEYRGKVLECLVEEPVDDMGVLWVGRFYGQAPEVDGVIYIEGYTSNMGTLVPVKIKKVKGYDLFGEVKI
ncbi:MAG: 30S ribosomal protein S12 methylthiotransferase RimO [Proteobacteria bacterium]|nr:30S ribosomal protein S12 methylthiotransferase RimO [Pseudomonadota bacterium]